MAKWIFDPGHGGTDPGAVYNNRKESDDNLKLSKAVADILRYNKQTVNFTRTNDTFVSLDQRVLIEKADKYDYFVSFHRNASNGSGKGIETFYHESSSKGKSLANNVQDRLETVFVGRGIKTANFQVIKNTLSPAILIEVGFIDNPGDNNIFDSKFNQIAELIAEGLLRQVNVNMQLPASKETYYRVICGSFKERSNAEARQKELADAGFTGTFLEAFEK